MQDVLFDLSLAALNTGCPVEKTTLVNRLCDRWSTGELSMETDEPILRIENPGHPEKLRLVSPRDLKKRKLSTPLGQSIFIHALAHIEFNAINLALDAVYRFRDMPGQFYTDWLSVAKEEANHHYLLSQRLNDFGRDYGDFPAHNGLWDMALQTDQDLLQRMALIPCVFEARGLDVTPPMIKRLEIMEDEKTADILRLILKEEVRHVAVGQKWFKYECQTRHLDAETTLVELIQEHLPNRKQGPFNFEARIKAGFSEFQLTRMEQFT
ncbi:MAG: DUF455 family protein [Gammaproteobacteria bacterium]|nr:DUF455 family protein [Gammaproteobacteria bacterium]